MPLLLAGHIEDRHNYFHIFNKLWLPVDNVPGFPAPETNSPAYPNLFALPWLT
jgi:hypothetical protein